MGLMWRLVLSIKNHQKKLQMVAKLPLFYSRTLDGHRREYLDFTIGLFGGERTKSYGMFLSPRPVLFLMIEDSFALYCAVALWRSLFGWKTAGLLFRPKPAVEATSSRLRIKRQILRYLRHINPVKTLSIIPVSLDPRFSEIVDDWIYDFQLWDISSEFREYFNDLIALDCKEISHDENHQFFLELANLAKGKATISAIGRQDKDKGFDLFATFSSQSNVASIWHFVVGGKVESVCENLLENLSANGNFVLNRFITDRELVALYASSSVVWCAYAEGYDQASGILGRAAQFGLPVIVREGSLNHNLCLAENISHFAFSDFNKLATEISKICELKKNNGYVLAQRFRSMSVRKLSDALGVQVIMKDKM